MKKSNTRKIYFDMDGTIANLYGVENWLSDLQNEITRPYEIAQPIYNTEKLNSLINTLKTFGYDFGVITWGSMNSTKEYDKEVKKVKREWIHKNYPTIKEFHFQKYGTPKHKATYQNIKINKDILIDDNKEVRKMWVEKGGIAINPNENLFNELAKLIS